MNERRKNDLIVIVLSDANNDIHINTFFILFILLPSDDTMFIPNEWTSEIPTSLLVL